MQDCDAAFMTCLGNEKCVDCFLELQINDIDWASVSKNTPCPDVRKSLYDKNMCKSLQGDETSEKQFCSTYETCVIWDDSDDWDADDDGLVDCSALLECNWPGIHPQWIGDGVCHDGMDGCYNTAVCGFDGGDCCEDTCNSSGNYLECGHDGYACRDPNSKKCNPLLTHECNSLPDAGNKTIPKCDGEQVLYRLVMYDSFGDGWDATKITIRSSTGQEIFQGGLEIGYKGTEYICLTRTGVCYNVQVSGGIWGNEVSWEVKPYSEGAPAVAGGGAPMKCDFALAGGTCASTCTGKPNIEPSTDPDYKQFKDMYNCIVEKCPIQVGACENDSVCKGCFTHEPEDYCFGVDTFNAVVDCTQCQCTDSKGSDFCSKKGTPGAVIPPDPSPGSNTKKPCSPAETVAGGNAVLSFSKCTTWDQVSMMVTEFDQNNFGDLDTFEACAHEFQKKTNHGGHTALGCMQILVNAMNGATDYEQKDNDKVPADSIAALAGLLYHDAHNFCDCAKNASDACPLCPSFMNFKTLLYESLDACQSLDEIDCDAWSEFFRPCKNNLMLQFGSVDFSKEEQCKYVHSNCGGAGPFPAFRRLDCGKEIPKAAWDFYNDYAGRCLENGGGDYTPAPVPKPQPQPNPAPPPFSPPDNGKPSDKKPYVPPEDRDKKDKNEGSKSNKSRSHWFRNVVLLCLIGGAIYYYYQHRSDAFRFIRYRRIGQRFGGEDDMYSGLALESSTTFEPPSLPPRPDATGADYYM